VGIFFDVNVVGPSVFDRRSRDEVLQLVFIPFVERLQLVVDIDEEVFCDQCQHVLVLRVDLSREKITCKGTGTEVVEPRGLELSLFAGQYQTYMVLTPDIIHRIGDHADEPFGQVFRPMPGVAHGDGRSQFVDGLCPRYRRQFMEIRLHGIHTLGEVAFEHAAQVLRRGGDADGTVEFPPEGVEPVFGHGEELAVAAAELCTAFDRVVTEGVMLPQELLDTLVPGLFVGGCNAV